MTVGADALVGICTGDFIGGVAVDAGLGAGDAAMVLALMTRLEIGGVGAVAATAVGSGADDVSGGVAPAVGAVDQGTIRDRGVALQAIGDCAIAVGIDQDVSAMTGLAAARPGEEGVGSFLVPRSKIGVVGGVAGDTGAALSVVDALVGCLQWP